MAHSEQPSSLNDRDRLQLENDPRFLRRIEQARASLRAGLGTRLEDLDKPAKR